MTGPAKTGGGGTAWIELERPKPPPVADIYRYWTDPPPEMSERCRYWLRQIDAGWRPNRRIRIESRDGEAAWYGVYMWELQHQIWWALDQVAGAWDNERP